MDIPNIGVYEYYKQLVSENNEDRTFTSEDFEKIDTAIVEKQKEVEKLKKAKHKLQEILNQKDSKILGLTERLKELSKKSFEPNDASKLIFSDFGFNSSELKALRNVNWTQKRDSLFVLECLRLVCRDKDTSTLTLSRGSRRSQHRDQLEKTPLPTDSTSLITRLFEERLDYACKGNVGEHTIRFARCKTLIAKNISRINKH